jgi:hypothetical protein
MMLRPEGGEFDPLPNQQNNMQDVTVKVCTMIYDRKRDTLEVR